MSVSELPRDLLNLVCSFCWDADLNQCRIRADQVCEALNYQVPSFLIRAVRYDWRDFKMRPGGLLVFDPHCSPTTFFREDIMFMILSILDFLKRDVRKYGSRMQWLKRIVLDWRAAQDFAIFFCEVISNCCNLRDGGIHVLPGIVDGTINHSVSRPVALNRIVARAFSQN